MTKTPKKTAKELTNKQALFIKEYVIDFNATRAAKAAGYSPKTAFTIGIENLKKPLIQTILAKEVKERLDKSEHSADEVIKRLWFFSDKDKAKYDAEKSSNTKATELLAKHYKLLTDKLEIGVNESVLAVILGALPPEQAESVKKALLAITTHKMKP